LRYGDIRRLTGLSDSTRSAIDFTITSIGHREDNAALRTAPELVSRARCFVVDAVGVAAALRRWRRIVL